MEDDVSEVRKEDQKKYCKCISKSRKLKFENYKMKNGRVRRMNKFAYYFEKLAQINKDIFTNMKKAQQDKIENLYEMAALLPYNYYINSKNIIKDYWKDEGIKDKHRIIKLLRELGIISLRADVKNEYNRSVKDEFILYHLINNYEPETRKTKFEKALDTVTTKLMKEDFKEIVIKADFFDQLRNKYNKLKELYPLITEEEFLSIENSYNIEEYKN